jgi:hypothetical protein
VSIKVFGMDGGASGNLAKPHQAMQRECWPGCILTGECKLVWKKGGNGRAGVFPIQGKPVEKRFLMLAFICKTDSRPTLMLC